MTDQETQYKEGFNKAIDFMKKKKDFCLDMEIESLWAEAERHHYDEPEMSKGVKDCIRQYEETREIPKKR